VKQRIKIYERGKKEQGRPAFLFLITPQISASVKKIARLKEI
jgi:hypothetical protein